MDDFSVRFNPRPVVQKLRLTTGQEVVVVDDALDLPNRLTVLARAVQSEFVQVPGNAFPGSQLRMDDDFSAKLDTFFRVHIRALLGGRHSVQMFARLSRVTLDPSQLDARQRICHRDSAGVDLRHTISACVLYLFDDTSLGGTVFFEPCVDSAMAETLVLDASDLEASQFADKYGWEASYMTESNAYFNVIGRVAAKYNRIIFYDGNIFHSSDIRQPEKLNAPGSLGRLSINGFFTSTRKAT